MTDYEILPSDMALAVRAVELITGSGAGSDCGAGAVYAGADGRFQPEADV